MYCWTFYFLEFYCHILYNVHTEYETRMYHARFSCCTVGLGNSSMSYTCDKFSKNVKVKELKEHTQYCEG